METNSSKTLPNKGKIPPQAIDLEIDVLGVMLVYDKSPEIAIEILKRENVFYKPQHQLIYEAMLDLFEESEPIDILTVSTKLKSQKKLEEAGGDFYLIQLTQKIVSSVDIEYHSRILQQMYIKRQMISSSSSLCEGAYNDDSDIHDLMENCYSELDRISEWMLAKKPKNFKQSVNDFYQEKPESGSGVPSSLSSIQQKTNGWQNSDLIIIAARPGMGKTALMLNEAYHAAKSGIPVGIFSLEMSERKLISRLLSIHCGIDSTRILQKRLTNDEKAVLDKEKPSFENLPISINDQQGLSPLEVNIQANRWKREIGVEIIFLDYLQLMNIKSKSNKGNREQEISAISRSLKGLAKDMNIPVIALSQLSRSVETRGGSKRPLLSDLRESGAIEQDADVVAFIYRPEYYRIEEWDDDEKGPTKNQAEIILAKIRDGEPGTCRVAAYLQFMKFSNLEGLDENDYDQAIGMADNSLQNKLKKINPWEEESSDDNGVPF